MFTNEDYEELKPIVIKKAKGSYLYSYENKKYLDIISSWWCNLLGHSNPQINKAVKKQIDKLEHVIFANFTHKKAIELCERLSKIIPQGLEKFFFTDNGSSAIEASLKMSLQYHNQTGNPQKVRFMALENAYHGETIGALSISGVDIYSKMYRPILLDTIRIKSPDCYRCPYNLDNSKCDAKCIEHAEKEFEKHGNETCAIVVEPLLQAAAGMKIYSPIYLKKLRALCDKYNIHLIADEIATGYGRLGKMFGCDIAGISPDIMCLSKGLTGGYMPMAIACVTSKIYDAFYHDYTDNKSFLHSHTYCANPLACSAAVEVLNILDKKPILKEASKKAIYFKEKIIEEFKEHKNVGDIRSIGLINAIELVIDKKEKTPFDSKDRIGYQIYKKALEKGLLLRPLGNVLYFNPPLTISKKEMAFAIKIAKESLVEILG